MEATDIVKIIAIVCLLGWIPIYAIGEVIENIVDRVKGVRR